MDKPIEGAHDFTVLAATPDFADIVSVGDVQKWDTPKKGETTTLKVAGKESFWATKQFKEASQNVYLADYVDGSTSYTLTLTFKRAWHMTAHEDVWMVYGARSVVGGLCDNNGGPPTWGGQNLN